MVSPTVTRAGVRHTLDLILITRPLGSSGDAGGHLLLYLVKTSGKNGLSTSLESPPQKAKLDLVFYELKS